MNNLCLQIEKGIKEYFFTGPYSIGKTFSLLEFKMNILNKINKPAYFNLEVLSNKENYFQILAYESRNLFENNDEWKDIFLQLKNKNKTNYLDLIINLIGLIPKIKSYNLNKKYIFILDQIKFKDESDYVFHKVNEIREKIKNIINVYLIGCCSINYHGVKKLLFLNWFHRDSIIPNINIDYINTLQSSNSENNKYLNYLGNLPRYRQLKDTINSKYINILCKIIKKKISKFFNDNNDLIYNNLMGLKINEPINDENFEQFLNNIPIKYFIINYKEKYIDFSYPLVKLAIEELLNTITINDYIYHSQSEKVWHFERKIINEIKTKHILNNYYIDNYYQINSIFLKEKIVSEFFDINENSFFYFKYCNVKHYDCALYFGKEKSLLLIQIALYRNKEQIKVYNNKNFTKDIKKMKKFLDVNNIEVNNYYLLFIFNQDEYEKTDFETLNSKGFKYYLYDLKHSRFSLVNNEIYQIKFSNSDNNEDIDNCNNIDNDDNDENNDDEENYIEFGKYQGKFSFRYNNDLFLYYYYKRMSLEKFINEVLSEEIGSNFKDILNIGNKRYYLSCVYDYCNKFYFSIHDNIGQEVLFIGLKDYIIYFGFGFVCFPYKKLTFNSYDPSLMILSKNINFNDNLRGFLFKCSNSYINNH